MNWAKLAPPLGLGLLLVQGCGSPQSPASQSAEEQTRPSTESESLSRREKAVPKGRRAEAPDGAWTAHFPSETDVEFVVGQGHIQAHFSLGTEAKTRCFLYQEPIDSGQVAGLILASMREKVAFEEILLYRVASAQGVPIVFVEGRYFVETARGRQLGGLKLAVSPRQNTPVLCFLDEPGFAETFASAITGLLASLETKEPDQKPAYSEIWKLSVDGKTTGFRWYRVLDPADGSQTTISITSTFVPTSPEKLSTTDEVEALENDSKGIAKGTFFAREDGKVVHHLAMSRSGKSKYRITGKRRGKELKSEFKEPHLTGTAAIYRQLLEKSQAIGTLQTTEFNPALDPLAPTSMRYTVDRSTNTLDIKIGSLSVHGKLADDGLPSELSMRQGEHEFTQKVLERSGHLDPRTRGKE